MRRIVVLLFVLAGACSSPEETDPQPDAATPADSGVPDVGSMGDVDLAVPEDSGAPGADAGSDAATTDVVCDITVEVQEGIALAGTQDEPVAAGSKPVICWTLAAGATPPGAGGWHVRVEREENAGGEMTEWVAQGVDGEATYIAYGDCTNPATCDEANELMPGSHFVSVWDEDEPSRVGGSTVVTVE